MSHDSDRRYSQVVAYDVFMRRRTDCAQQLTMASLCLPFKVQCHSQGGSTLSSSLYCSESPYILQPV